MVAVTKEQVSDPVVMLKEGCAHLHGIVGIRSIELQHPCDVVLAYLVSRKKSISDVLSGDLCGEFRAVYTMVNGVEVVAIARPERFEELLK